MKNGHYVGPRRATWDVGECALHYDYRNAGEQRSWKEAGLTRTADTEAVTSQPVRRLNPLAWQRVNASTGWYGVGLRESGRYQARFKLDGVVHHVGIYDTAEEAAQAHDDYCEAHGINRKLNRDLVREDVSA